MACSAAPAETGGAEAGGVVAEGGVMEAIISSSDMVAHGASVYDDADIDAGAYDGAGVGVGAGVGDFRIGRW